MDHIERIKILKLMWDAMCEFGGRHRLYKIRLLGQRDEIRLQCLRRAPRAPAIWTDDGNGRSLSRNTIKGGWTGFICAITTTSINTDQHCCLSSGEVLMQRKWNEQRLRVFSRAMTSLAAAVNIVTPRRVAGRCNITAATVCSSPIRRPP